MPITIRATIQTSAPSMLALRVVYVEVDGDRVTLGEGSIDKGGVYTLTCELPRGGKTILPDLVLEDSTGRRLASSGHLVGTTLSFGTIVVSEAPVAVVEGVTWIGLPAPVAARITAAEARASLAAADLKKALLRSAELEASLAVAASRSAGLEKELATATDTTREALAAASRDLARLEAARVEVEAKAEASLAVASGELAKVEAARVEAEAKATDTAVRVAVLEKEQLGLVQLAAEGAQRAEALSAELSVATSRHDAVSTDRAQVQAQLAATEVKLAHAVETTSVYQNGEARLEYVVRAIGSQLEDARATLDQAGSRYKVNKVSATLRVVPDKTGSLFSFPSPETVTDPATLSELVIELEETAPPTRAPVAPALLVPRLLGLTRVAIERVLRKAGLTPAFVSETVSDSASVGRCVRQSPIATTPTTPGAVVAVYLGKQLTSGSGL